MSTDTKNVTTLSSGATAYIVGETSAVTASTPQFGQKVLNARKFAVLIKGTQELIDDNMSDEEVMTLVAKLAAESLAELEDAQVLTGAGTGSNMTGITVDANVNVVTMGTGDTSFADVTYAYLVAVKNAVKAKYKKASKGKIAWVMSQDIFNHIESIVDTT
jgi:HK97 family phage major capsid protein